MSKTTFNGWQRIWIILSAAWLALILAFVSIEINDQYQYQISKYENDLAEYNKPLPEGLSQKDLYELNGFYYKPKVKPTPIPSFFKWLKLNTSKLEISLGLTLLIIPPLLLYWLGLLISWVTKGFRQQDRLI